VITLLRRTRVAIACVVFVLSVAAFIPGHDGIADVGMRWLALQFVPAAARLVYGPAGVVILVLLGLLALTLVLGRVYCACLCPLGIAQDMIRRIGRAIPWLKRSQDRVPTDGALRARRAVRHSVLGLTLVGCSLGSLSVLNLVEPYSFFARLSAGILRPLVELTRRVLATVLERFELYTFSSPIQQPFSGAVFVALLALSLALIVASLLRGRLFCNTLCPVGAFLGLVSRLSVFRITVDLDACASCRRCASECRTDCIALDEATKPQVDDSACVRCFDCLAVCPLSGLSYAPGRPLRKQRGQVTGGTSRREFVVLGAASAVCAAAVPLHAAIARRLLPLHGPVTPPGSEGIEHFTSACTGCHLCVAACPTGVIKPALFAYGLRGMMQPRLSYEDAYCAYDCIACAEACPTGAIKDISLDDKQLTQIGLAFLHKDRCIVHVRGEECGACAEVCPTHAAFTIERDGILLPDVRQGLCIGCGACENVCPQRPRAIDVTACARHGRALPPFASKRSSSDPEQPMDDDFPF